jgi:hypothetical protein
VLLADTVSVELVFAVEVFDEEDAVLLLGVGVLGVEGGEVRDCPLPREALRIGRCRMDGAGKLSFLSMASTVRWKRRKRASARTSVLSNSIEVESSLTVSY